ncbi:hypothetical protein [Methylocella silvestris]|uniref:hypothetical protein n=1 Tax=Methylocella silvestris TaxID=199596 RepID=UPI0015E115B2|nr:hypothetical protein [Methylocella silvestris]
MKAVEVRVLSRAPFNFMVFVFIDLFVLSRTCFDGAGIGLARAAGIAAGHKQLGLG